MAEGRLLELADRLLLLPDLFGHWLADVQGAEATNASTTGMADVRTGRWAPDLVDLAGIRPGLLPPSTTPARSWAGCGARSWPTPGSARGRGSWRSAPTTPPRPSWPSPRRTRPSPTSPAARGAWSGSSWRNRSCPRTPFAANFTNERGVDDRIRYLRNVMGLWVLQQCVAEWEAEPGQRGPVDLTALLAAAADVAPGGPLVDVDDPRLLPPGPMVARVRTLVEEAGGRAPAARAEVVRCVLESLAAAFARSVADAVRLSGRDVRVVHLVGGGARNGLLCRLTADACGLPVVAGPWRPRPWGTSSSRRAPPAT